MYLYHLSIDTLVALIHSPSGMVHLLYNFIYIIEVTRQWFLIMMHAMCIHAYLLVRDDPSGNNYTLIKLQFGSMGYSNRISYQRIHFHTLA